MSSSASSFPVAESPLAEAHREALRRWSAAWGLPGLDARVKVEVSGRLTRSLGRCEPAKGEIRIARWLCEEAHELLPEVLCHELAHLAAWELHAGPSGPAARPVAAASGLLGRVRGLGRRERAPGAAGAAALRPHGREWKELMRQAGFAPRARIPESLLPASVQARGRAGWDHSCPVCGARRIARRRMPQWRCRACREAGLAGDLLIIKLAP